MCYRLEVVLSILRQERLFHISVANQVCFIFCENMVLDKNVVVDAYQILATE